LTREEAKYMSECHKAGIRIYPIPKYGDYYLEVEFNKTSMFLPKDIKKIIKGKERYKSKGNEWVQKIHELYKHFYEKQIQPNSEKNELRKVS